MNTNSTYSTKSNPIVLFDGLCNLCNASVRFLLAYNRKENLHFATLQSEYAKKLLSKYNLPKASLETIIFIDQQKIYTESTAAFEISNHLIYPWKSIHFFKYLPKTITDWIYKQIAQNRYNWFGRKKECMVPRPEWKHRFRE